VLRLTYFIGSNLTLSGGMAMRPAAFLIIIKEFLNVFLT